MSHSLTLQKKFSEPGNVHESDLSKTELQEIREVVYRLESFGHRGSGTKNEQIAASYVREQLDARGATTTVTPFRGQSSYGARILTHLFLGITGLVLVFWSPVASFTFSLIVLASFLCETSGLPLGLSNLLPGRISQNVTGVISRGEPLRRIVVCAHVDTQQAGWIWNTNSMKFFTSSFGLLPGPLKAPLFLVTVAFLLQTIIAISFMFQSPLAYTGVWLPGLSGVYLISIVLVAQWSLGNFVPGANDNASGVAAALALANRWQASEHPDTELLVLITGCEEPGLLGASNWVAQNRTMLAETPTVFVNLDVLGCRDLHFLKSECALNGLSFSYPPELRNICHEVAEQMDLPFQHSHAIPTHTDGLAFLIRNIQGITITSSESGIFVPHYHAMSDRAENLSFPAIQQATEFAWRVITRLERL